MTKPLVAQTNTHNLILVKVSFWDSRNSAANVEELVRESQNDKTPSSSDKYSYNLILVKVSFWDSRNSRCECEGVSSRVSK